MAVAMCALPSNCIPAGMPMNDRFYKFGTPSPPSVPQRSPVEYQPSPCYPASDLEDSGFHSDEEMQKVRRLVCALSRRAWRA